MSANAKQFGGDHYKQLDGGEEHWDRIWRLFGPGYFIGCITKYVERHQKKNGIEDLKKAAHFLEKLIELYEAQNLVQTARDETLNRIDIAGIISEDKGYTPATISQFTHESGQVKAGGWMSYVFEGADSKGFLYTCKYCNQHFYIPAYTNPYQHHKCDKQPAN